MLFKQFIEAFDIIDSKNVNGNSVASYLKSIKQDADIQVYPLVGPKGSTDMLKIRIPGLHGKTSGGDAPTIGLLGRLGGLGARPERIGYVSDGDGALVAIALAAKLLDMQNKGDFRAVHRGDHAKNGDSGLQIRRLDVYGDRKSTRLNSSHTDISRMPSSA